MTTEQAQLIVETLNQIRISLIVISIALAVIAGATIARGK